MFFELDKVDRIIERFQSYYPKGSDFSESTPDIPDRKEKASMLKFLVTEGILEPWGGGRGSTYHYRHREGYYNCDKWY